MSSRLSSFFSVSSFAAFVLTGACTDLKWSNAVAVRTLGGSSWICQGVDAEIIVPSPSGTQRCLVTGVRQLSDAEAKALRYYR